MLVSASVTTWTSTPNASAGAAAIPTDAAIVTVASSHVPT